MCTQRPSDQSLSEPGIEAENGSVGSCRMGYARSVQKKVKGARYINQNVCALSVEAQKAPKSSAVCVCICDTYQLNFLGNSTDPGPPANVN